MNRKDLWKKKKNLCTLPFPKEQTSKRYFSSSLCLWLACSRLIACTISAMHYIRHCYLLLIKSMELYCGFVINCFFFFFFSVYKFRKKYIAAYIALKVMQSTRFLYYIHIGATILATSFIQTLISVLVTMCRRQNITLFERFHKELLLNDFLNLFQGICNFYAPLPSILHSE